MGADICFPLIKYSYATGVLANNKIPWNHVLSSNLFIIVKGTDKTTKDEQLMLRIVQGSEVLESIDLAAYIDSAVARKHTGQSRGEVVHTPLLPIFGMAKETMFALRYVVQGTVPRRVQVRLHSAAECRQLVNAFATRGMDFMEPPSGTARPDTARPLTVNVPLPVSAQDPPNLNSTQPTNRQPFAPKVLEAGSLSQIRPRSPERSNSASFKTAPQSVTDTPSMLPPSLVTRYEALAPPEVAPIRPSPTHSYRSHTTQPETLQTAACQTRPIYAESNGSGSSAFDPAARSANNATSNPAPLNTNNAPNGHYGMKLLPQIDEPQLKALGSDDTLRAGLPSFEGLVTGNASYGDRSSTMRPSTSSSLVFAPTLEHEIPPRRELPFARPDSRRSGSTSSRPGSALALPPLPKPRLSKQDSTTASAQQAQKPSSPARPHTSSPLKRPFADVDLASAGPDRPYTASPQKASQARIPLPQASAKKPIRTEQDLDGKKTSLEQCSASGFLSSKLPRLDSLADAPGEIDESYVRRDASPNRAPIPRNFTSPLRHPNATGEYDPTVKPYAAISMTAQDDISLQRYARQSLEDRQAALDEFMVRNLENPDFVKLCKDIENCWKRIVLGL